MDMHVTLKNAHETDLALLLSFMQAYYAFDRLDFDAAKAEAALTDLIRNPTLGQVWLVVAETEVVGYAVLTLGYSLEYHGRDAFIDELYLQASSRRQGIGRQVMALLEEEARSRGAHALHLEVERENKAAYALYQKTGYEEHDRHLLTKRLQS